MRIAALDAEAWDQLRLLERPERPGTLARVLLLYLRNAEDLHARIHAAHRAGDCGELHRALHNLRASSASVGASALAALLRPWEQDAKAGVDALDAERLAAIADELAAVERALRARLGELPQSL